MVLSVRFLESSVNKGITLHASAISLNLTEREVRSVPPIVTSRDPGAIHARTMENEMRTSTIPGNHWVFK
jgi:hypothetical protein